MIQVQIAATVLEDGVGETRWVLVDDGDVPPAAQAPAAAVTTPPARAASRPNSVVLLLAKLLVLAGALGGAWAASLAILQARPTAHASVVGLVDKTPAIEVSSFGQGKP